jgi:hypothetical protein
MELLLGIAEMSAIPLPGISYPLRSYKNGDLRIDVFTGAGSSNQPTRASDVRLPYGKQGRDLTDPLYQAEC